MAERLHSTRRRAQAMGRFADSALRLVNPPRLLVVAGMLLCALAACSKHSGADHGRSSMSERQRDSTIAKSRLPGAGVVGRALAVSDSPAARAARLD